MATNNQEILAQLQEAKQNNAGLTELVDLHSDLLAAQMHVQVDLAAPQYSAEEVRARFGQGVPLLRPQEMTLDWEAFSNLYRQICQITALHRPDLSAQLEELLMLLDDDPHATRDIVTAYIKEGNLVGYREPGEEQAELLSFVLNHALRPFLQAYADTLAPLEEQQFWQRGKCPICGGEPDFAFLDRESSARHLVCSRCDSQWVFPRVKCPFCNTSEPSNLSYYPSQDERHRLYVCRNCQRYVKAIDLRKATGPVLYPVERITTVALDVAAREEGFR